MVKLPIPLSGTGLPGVTTAPRLAVIAYQQH